MELLTHQLSRGRRTDQTSDVCSTLLNNVDDEPLEHAESQIWTTGGLTSVGTKTSASSVDNNEFENSIFHVQTVLSNQNEPGKLSQDTEHSRLSQIRIRWGYNYKRIKVRVQNWKKKVHDAGWEATAVLYIVAAGLVFIVNFTMTVVAATAVPQDSFQAGILFQGDCSYGSFLNQLAHVFVNVMSTLLLGGSNYYMQLLAAPRRSDVDRAHRRRETCDIGIPSFRNFWTRVIDPWRTLIWTAIVLSSLPLHLFWNSTFFYSPYTYMYSPIVVTTDFVESDAVIPPWRVISKWHLNSDNDQLLAYYPWNLTEIQANLSDKSQFDYLDALDCIKTYGGDFLYDRSDVVIITQPDYYQAAFQACPQASCPWSDGHLYSTRNSNQFQIRFDVDFSEAQNGGNLNVSSATSLQDCAELCAQNAECEVGVFSNLDNNCYLRPSALNFERSWSVNSSVVRISDTPSGSTNTSILWIAMAGFANRPDWWMCFAVSGNSDFNCAAVAESNLDDWIITPEFEPIFHTRGLSCYSKREPQKCKLEYSFTMGLIVTVCNLVKLILFTTAFYMLRRRTSSSTAGDNKSTKADPLLVTTGDAVASFLENEDLTTSGMCLAEKRDFENGIFAIRWVAVFPMQWHHNPSRSWLRTIGVRRWLLSIFSCAIVPLAALILFFRIRAYLNSIGFTTYEMMRQGIGVNNPELVFNLPSPGPWFAPDQTTSVDFYCAIVLANLPQVFLSSVYFIANNYLTCMLTAREYSRYKGEQKKKIRVSWKANDGQEAIGFFCVPIKYAVSVMITSAAVQWLASEAFFFTKIDVVDQYGRLTSFSIRTVGYSPLGIISFAIAGFSFAFLIHVVSVRRLPKGTLITATCSASISAACHPSPVPPGDIPHHKSAISWGVEVDINGKPIFHENDAARMSVARCTFTSSRVIEPEEGELYA